MKKCYRFMVGITLLELMLVLAISGAVIAMSIKYYQQVATNQRILAGMGVISSIVAALESYRLSGRTFTTIKTEDITPYLSGHQLPKSPWNNSDIKIAGVKETEYTITIATTDGNACKVFTQQIQGQQGFTSTCDDKNPPNAMINVTSG